MRRVVITGMGAITPVGLSVEEFWNSVKEGKTNFAEVTRFDSSKYRAHMAAEINNFNAKDYMDFKSAKRMELFSQYAVAAAKGQTSLIEKVNEIISPLKEDGTIDQYILDESAKASALNEEAESETEAASEAAETETAAE